MKEKRDLWIPPLETIAALNPTTVISITNSQKWWDVLIRLCNHGIIGGSGEIKANLKKAEELYQEFIKSTLLYSSSSGLSANGF